MWITLSVVVILCLTAQSFVNANSNEVIVQLFEWSWRDIARECETFLPLYKYTAVQVSPPQEHIIGSEWWTRYQPVSYILTSRSGNEEEFKQMVDTCNANNIAVYVDVVVNHMASGQGTGTAGSQFQWRSFPGLYNQEDFHHSYNNPNANCAVTNYQDKFNVQHCDLVSLPDLDTASPKVQQVIAAYIDKLISLGVKGIRLDAAKHQDADEMRQYLTKVAGINNVFVYQEVISGQGEPITPEMYFTNGAVTEFNYGRSVNKNIIVSGKMKYFSNFGPEWGFIRDDKAVVFIGNHDTQRSGDPMELTFQRPALYTIANMFMLAHSYGQHVRVMSSYKYQSFNDGPPATPVHNGDTVNCYREWVCEHRWAAIYNMVVFRNQVQGEPVRNFFSEGDNRIAFSRGSKGFIAINRDEGFGWQLSNVKVDLPDGMYCDIVHTIDIKECKLPIEVRGGVIQSVNVPELSAIAIHTGALVPTNSARF